LISSICSIETVVKFQFAVLKLSLKWLKSMFMSLKFNNCVLT